MSDINCRIYRKNPSLAVSQPHFSPQKQKLQKIKNLKNLIKKKDYHIIFLETD